MVESRLQTLAPEGIVVNGFKEKISLMFSKAQKVSSKIANKVNVFDHMRLTALMEVIC